eukprot:TRINITY_DN11188_c0_g1_i1.p1 TRINITY_DN11188_c0_g1~~TRINITY_DN11188_c0_g1_i1.p1  ORF type:complete len:375 (+),score=64.16 TRINITY_DN11188_c0_g1_i1:81-1205(+)
MASVFFLDLPDDVIQCVSMFLQISDVCALTETCKQLCELMSSTPLWQNLCIRHNLEEHTNGWRAAYVEGVKKNTMNWHEGKCGITAYPGHTSYVMGVAFNNTHCVSVGGISCGRVLVWSVTSSGQLAPLHDIAAHTAAGIDIALCGNLAASTGYDSTSRLIDVDAGRVVHTYDLSNTLHGYSVSMTADVVCTATTKGVQIHRTTDTERVCTYDAHASVNCLHISDNVIYRNVSDQFITARDLNNLDQVRTFDNDGALHAEDTMLVCAGSYRGTVHFYDTRTESRLFGIELRPDNVSAVSFNMALRTAIVLDNTGRMTVLDLRKNAVLYALALAKRPLNSGQFDARKVIVGNDDHDVVVVDYWTQAGDAPCFAEQ